FFLAASLGLMIPVVIEFAETGLVPRMPTWVLSIGMLLLAMLSMMTGLILDSVSRGRAEQKRIFYLSISSGRAERGTPAQALPKGEAGKASRAA
ncbi:MAG: glycosyl transferase, partial [Mesorhizobium sp.]